MPMQVCGGASNSASPAKKQWASAGVGVRAARGILIVDYHKQGLSYLTARKARDGDPKARSSR